MRNYVEANDEYTRRGLFNRLYEAVELSGRCSFSPALGSAAESFWLQVVACKCRQMSSPVLLLLQGLIYWNLEQIVTSRGPWASCASAVMAGPGSGVCVATGSLSGSGPELSVSLLA